MRLAKAIMAVGVAACLAVCAACSTAPAGHYAWGSYEELIYIEYNKPGELTPEAQIDALEKDRLEAQALVRPLPPGWHAQLASLYAQVGRVDLAQEELLAEKTAFPESAVLVDRLLANLKTAAEAR
jgi:hypothetical protein